MRCRSPRTVGFKSDGKTICWSKKEYSKEFATFQLPCGKCLECRLDYARQWAIRCVHEAAMHEKNSFITLTYDPKIKNPTRLDYRDFQLFMKKLRKLTDKKIGFFTTGEYGDETKRPHWHAIIFGWEPPDQKYLYSNDRGDKIYTSQTLDKTWSYGNTQTGAVTFESAGYCARYAAKKLCHGQDQNHDYHPISKKSSKHAIGKAWLEKYWRDAFNTGEIILLHSDNTVSRSSIPRYYEKWLKQHQPDAWLKYTTETKLKKMISAQEKSEKELNEYVTESTSRPYYKQNALTPQERKSIILEEKFKKLQEKQKC